MYSILYIALQMCSRKWQHIVSVL